jgi:hypothetical protein
MGGEAVDYSLPAVTQPLFLDTPPLGAPVWSPYSQPYVPSTPVPEMSTWVMMLVGFAGMVWATTRTTFARRK